MNCPFVSIPVNKNNCKEKPASAPIDKGAIGSESFFHRMPLARSPPGPRRDAHRRPRLVPVPLLPRSRQNPRQPLRPLHLRPPGTTGTDRSPASNASPNTPPAISPASWKGTRPNQARRHRGTGPGGPVRNQPFPTGARHLETAPPPRRSDHRVPPGVGLDRSTRIDAQPAGVRAMQAVRGKGWCRSVRFAANFKTYAPGQSSRRPSSRWAIVIVRCSLAALRAACSTVRFIFAPDRIYLCASA